MYRQQLYKTVNQQCLAISHSYLRITMICETLYSTRQSTKSKPTDFSFYVVSFTELLSENKPTCYHFSSIYGTKSYHLKPTTMHKLAK